MTIGEAHQTVRSANRRFDDRGQGVPVATTEIKLFSSFIGALNDPLAYSKPNIFVNFLVRCANNIQIMYRGFFFVLGPPLPFPQDASVRH
jgi:hypothetical protein